ncbi:MAG: hypothetical protein JO232_13570 [Verrucomicrobia bacterium]|nr:hypothetical protein [Verrucomicrobiota bacterium]
MNVLPIVSKVVKSIYLTVLHRLFSSGSYRWRETVFLTRIASSAAKGLREGHRPVRSHSRQCELELMGDERPRVGPGSVKSFDRGANRLDATALEPAAPAALLAFERPVKLIDYEQHQMP